VSCERILSLRKGVVKGKNIAKNEEEEVKPQVYVDEGETDTVSTEEVKPKEDEPGRKRPRGLTFEEYEAALDEDPNFDAIDFNELELP